MFWTVTYFLIWYFILSKFYSFWHAYDYCAKLLSFIKHGKERMGCVDIPEYSRLLERWWVLLGDFSWKFTWKLLPFKGEGWLWTYFLLGSALVLLRRTLGPQYMLAEFVLVGGQRGSLSKRKPLGQRPCHLERLEMSSAGSRDNF